MERALVILLNLSTSQLTYNSLESSAMLTVPSMSAVSDTESALRDAVMGILSERLAWAALIATLTYTAMFNSQELANTLFSLASYATHLTCVTWVADVGLTPVKLRAESAWSISLCQQDLVSFKTADNILLAIYANSPQDLLMCSDGYGALDSKFLSFKVHFFSPYSWASWRAQFLKRSLSLWKEDYQWKGRYAMQDIPWLPIQHRWCLCIMWVHLFRHIKEMWHSSF